MRSNTVEKATLLNLLASKFDPAQFISSESHFSLKLMGSIFFLI